MARSRAESAQVERQSLRVPIVGGELAAFSVRPANRAAGPVAIFVHGKTFPCVPDFDLQVPGAAQTYSYMEYLAARGVHCWTFDHRGFGASFKPATGTLFTSRVRARDLAAVLGAVRRASGSSPLALIGLSLGCATIASVLERDPVAADRVVLLGPSQWRRMGTIEAKAEFIASARKAGRQRSSYTSTDFASLEKRLWVGEEALVGRAAFEHFVSGAIAANPEGPADRVVALISNILPFAKRPVIGVPVLAVRGADDTLATDEDLDAVRRLIDPKLVSTRVFARRKHDLHLYNEREDVFASILEFVKG
jgi:pimeloyl-ACP methyl ester carboxylesterase